MRRACVLFLMAATSPLAAVDPGGTAATRARFIARHRCAIVARLDAMHRRGPVGESRDRFIIVALRGERQRYVQCIFHARDTRMFCEASSGAYGPAGDGRLRLGAAEQAALRALGYVQASPRENFARDVEMGDPPDFTIVADQMLSALHDGYGARPESVIEITAPHGGDPGAICNTPES
ncbi:MULTISPECIES: TY-Chap domain-containing protein [unclassified Methylobacterium]|jgi:hypothetical protein|uniref:TY-Chap domain-containing protein n=1 Tax=unclassified Methylobacterium TaxID=2615210 RepID=UPI001354C38C|nr:hypothetical protein [Methylobacterium sp. 2A]MWV23177.1 hypothetical protein [Methylobacterium sp. 2A]